MTFEKGNLPAGVYHFRMSLAADQDHRTKTGRLLILE